MAANPEVINVESEEKKLVTWNARKIDAFQASVQFADLMRATP